MWILLLIFFVIIAWFLWYAEKSRRCDSCGGELQSLDGTKKFICVNCGHMQ